MDRFIIDINHCSLGFQEYARINLLTPISETSLRRRRLYPRNSRNNGNPEELRKIINHNSSLRVDFGWSFESEYCYKTIMNECLNEVIPQYNEHAGIMMTDLSCSWLGFVPHNSYDRELYNDFNPYELILFNNEIIQFQMAVIKFISNHLIFRQHAIMRDHHLRFNFFKSFRKDRDGLVDSYHFYMKAVRDISLLSTISRDIVEEQIGCHFLYNTDLFFELLEFSILKGEIHE